MLFIVITFFITTKGNITVKKNDSFLFFLIASAISCGLSYMYDYILPHISIVRRYLVNCIAYIVMYILLSNMKNDVREHIIESYINGLIYAARIQAIWGIL